MRAAGYVTVSVVTNPFAGKTSGLQRGFDYMMEYPVVHRYRSEAADRGSDSAALNTVLFSWLERHRNEPFFLYAHSTDPHAPYRYHPEYASRLGIRGRGEPPKADRYDTEIAETDHAIGRLLEAFAKARPGDPPLVVFASDHGESLGEHGTWGHGRDLYDVCLRIPMVADQPSINLAQAVQLVAYELFVAALEARSGAP